MSPPPLQQQKPRRSRNSTRDREKAELLALRRLAGELEAHLATLTAPRVVPRQPFQAMASTWKGMAERQKVARYTTESKNRELMARVQRNADWIQRLWELLRETRSLGHSLVDEGRHGSKWSDAVVFERLKLEARAASWKTLQEFAAQGICISEKGSTFDNGQQAAADRWSHVFDAERGISQLVCVRRLPFDAHTTSGAVWSALTVTENPSSVRSVGSRAVGDGAYTGLSTVFVLERSHDACALKYQQELSFAGQTAPIRCHAVAQALAGGEAQGAKLFVWRSMSAMEFCDDSREAISVASTDNLWIAVTTCPSSQLASTVAIIAQSQVESAPEAPRVPSCLTHFQEAVKAAVERCVGEIVLQAENLLMDGEVARRENSSVSAQGDATV